VATTSIVGGGSENNYTKVYFEIVNSESADTFLQAIQGWVEDPRLQELLKANQAAIKDFSEKRDILDGQLTKLMYKTQLNGNCEFTRPTWERPQASFPDKRQKMFVGEPRSV